MLAAKLQASLLGRSSTSPRRSAAARAKVMALALALSVIASTGVSIVILARMIYGMASDRAPPSILGNVSPRFATPAGVASVVVLPA